LSIIERARYRVILRARSFGAAGGEQGENCNPARGNRD
jgi:hypothetical protein